MAKTKKKPAAEEEEEIIDLPDDDEEIVSLESIKKRFLKKGKEQGYINTEDIMEATSHLDLSDEDFEDFVKAAIDYRLSHTPPESGIKPCEGPLDCLTPEETLAAVKAYEELFGLEVDGFIGPATWDSIVRTYSDLRLGFEKQPEQYPGYVLEMQEEDTT